MMAVFSDGRIIDLILALTALEALGLTLFYRRTGKGVPPRALLPNLLAGACLLAAVRLALAAARWEWVALCLAASLPAHLADLRQRFHHAVTPAAERSP